MRSDSEWTMRTHGRIRLVLKENLPPALSNLIHRGRTWYCYYVLSAETSDNCYYLLGTLVASTSSSNLPTNLSNPLMHSTAFVIYVSVSTNTLITKFPPSSLTLPAIANASGTPPKPLYLCVSSLVRSGRRGLPLDTILIASV